jgi:hypothetical protein
MTSAPATVAIGRARIETLAASVSCACTCFACSGMADAHSAADDAASAALLTARWAVPLKRSTCDAALSAILSVVWCAVCATSSTLALAGFAPLSMPVRLPPHWRGSIHINSLRKKLRDRKSYRRCSRVCGRTIGLPTRRYYQTQSDFVVGQFPQCRTSLDADPASRSRAARASPFGLAQVKALAHLRHHIPPAKLA